jgi:Tol biopolymer transport system component
VRTLIPALAVLALALALSARGGSVTAPPDLVVSSNYKPLLYGDLFVVGAAGGGRRNLTHSPYDDQLPSVDPTGRRIAFISDRSGYRAIWMIGVDGKGLRRVTGRLPNFGFPNSQPLWDPTGRWLLFEGYSNGSPSFTVWTVPVSGGHALKVGVGSHGIWSPAGLVTFETERSIGGRARARTVTRSGALRWSAFGTQPLWSPGGLLAVNHDGGLPADIFDRPGHRLRTVAGYAVSWSARGELLASIDHGKLWITDRGGHRSQVSATPAGNGVWWTPDGKKLSYAAYRPAGHAPSGRAAVYDVASHRTSALPGAGPWSRDSSRFAYTDPSNASLYVSTAGGTVRRVTESPTGEPDWAAGDRLVYAFSHGGEAAATLHFARATGGLAGAAGTPGNRWEATADWSPDGHSIAFSAGFPLCHASHCQRYLDNDIWVRDASGSPSRQLTSTTSPGNSRQVDDANPVWSPDGATIAFTRTPYGGNLQQLATQVWAVPSSGGATLQLAAHGGRPSWSPDGKNLSFRSDGVVAVAGADGSGFREFPDALVRSASDVAWSPDGSKLAAIAPNGDVFTITPAGGGRTVVGQAGTRGPAAVAWSPDSTRLAVSGAGLRVNRIRDGHTTRLDARDGATRPRWSPDGSRIAYTLKDLHTLAEEAYVVSATGGKPVDLVPGPSQEDDPAWRPR